MKNLLYLIAIVLFISCAPKKVITATKTEAKSEINNNISDTKNSQEIKDATKDEQTDIGTETTTKTTLYSEKKDTATGKQMIISITEKTTKKQEKKASKEVVNTDKKKAEAHKDNSKINNDVKADSKVKEIPKTPWIDYACWLVGIIASMAGLFFIRKYWTVIKSFFGLNNK